jgi:hypothetical protein
MELNVHLLEYWIDKILKFVYLERKKQWSKGQYDPTREKCLKCLIFFDLIMLNICKLKKKGSS